MHTRFFYNVVAAGLAALSLPLAAQAQTHIGNGQAVHATASVLSPVATVQIGSAVAGPQPASGSNFSVGPSAFADNLVLANLGGGGTLVGGVDNFVSVDASAVTGTSNGGGGTVLSTAQIGALGANNPSATIGFSTPLSGATPLINLTNFLTVRAIRTETLAVGGARTSTTIIEGLALRNGTGSFISVSNSLLGLAGNGTMALDGTVNLSYGESDATVGIGVASSVLGGDLATVFLHEKVTNGDGSRTTNGIHVALGNDGLLSNVANANVYLASSTAGVTDGTSAAAPEPGSIALFGTAALPLLGLARKRRPA